MENNTKKDEEAGEFLPPLDFTSLVFPFYTQALVKLGLMEDPLKNKSTENLEFAKRLIDMLDLLKERTKGNLKPDEEKFLESCLLQLKMNYMKKANIIKV
jgi:ABC-type hemin transport system ATPase subunit